MPIKGIGWEFHIKREIEQDRAAGNRRRTVGSYQIYHDGVEQNGPGLSGTVAESRGPGKNEPKGNGKRVEEGRYTLWTQSGTKYKTYNYEVSDKATTIPKPGLELKRTGARKEILIHPGYGFLASIGCINPCTSLPNKDENIDFVPSRDRVIAIIENLKRYSGGAFPKKNGFEIPNAFAVIDGEP